MKMSNTLLVISVLFGLGGYLYISYLTNLLIQNEYQAGVRICQLDSAYQSDSLLYEFKELEPGGFRYQWRDELNQIEVNSPTERMLINLGGEPHKIVFDYHDKSLGSITIHQ